MNTVFDVAPPGDHPDRDLLADVAATKAYYEAWYATPTPAAQGAILLREKAQGWPSFERNRRLAASQAHTMAGLIAKADVALREWRRDTDVNRYHRICATTSACLEQAIATLQALDHEVVPVIVKADTD